MKNIILGIAAVFIIIYTVLIGLHVLTIQSHKNQLEKHTSRIVKNMLENEYQCGDETAVGQMLQEEIEGSISSNGQLFVEIQAIDLQKGILSVKVTERIDTITGKQKDIVVEKTAIMEQTATNLPKVMVTFLIEDEVYKEYEITKGKACPLPKEPSGNFSGWKELGAEELATTDVWTQVWENRVYEAVFE